MSEPTYLSSPLSVTWSLSFRCNFDCRHCYSRGDSSPELPLPQLRRIVDVLVGHGVSFASLGGGEPLLFAELWELARYATDRGLAVAMNSNGFLLDREVAGRIRDAGFASVGISLDSHETPLHDAFRDRPGSFVRAVAALEALREAGVKTTMSTVICRVNHRHLREIAELARTHGVAQLFLHNFKCSGKGLPGRVELDLTPAEWREFYQGALSLQREFTDLPVSFDDPVMAALPGFDRRPLVKGSACGKVSLNIRPNGDLTPCGFLPLVLGNILRDDLDRLWHESPVLTALRTKRPTGKCARCSSYAECLGGCSARAFALSGTFEAPDPHCWVG